MAQAEFTSAEHVKSRLEGSRRGPPRRELDAPPAAQEKAIEAAKAMQDEAD